MAGAGRLYGRPKSLCPPCGSKGSNAGRRCHPPRAAAPPNQLPFRSYGCLANTFRQLGPPSWDLHAAIFRTLRRRSNREASARPICVVAAVLQHFTARPPPRFATMDSAPPPESQPHVRRWLRGKQPPPPAYGGASAYTSDVRVYQDSQGSTTYYPPIFADAPAGQEVRGRVGADRDGAGV